MDLPRSLSAGLAIWCTHVVAMIGFDAGVSVRVAPPQTIASLLIAVCCCTLGFTLAGAWRWRNAGAVGGGFAGLSITALH